MHLHLHTRLTLSERGREVGCLNDKVINLTTVRLLILSVIGLYVFELMVKVCDR